MVVEELERAQQRVAELEMERSQAAATRLKQQQQQQGKAETPPQGECGERVLMETGCVEG